jgi:hypothetical protein
MHGDLQGSLVPGEPIARDPNGTVPTASSIDALQVENPNRGPLTLVGSSRLLGGTFPSSFHPKGGRNAGNFFIKKAADSCFSESVPRHALQYQGFENHPGCNFCLDKEDVEELFSLRMVAIPLHF